MRRADRLRVEAAAGETTIVFGGQRISSVQVAAVDLETRGPNLRLAVVAIVGGGGAVPALSALAASEGTTAVMIAGLAAAALSLFAGCFQLVSGGERYRISLQLQSGDTRVETVDEREAAHGFIEAVERLGKPRLRPRA